MKRKDEIWKTDSLVQTFLAGMREGIPFAAEQVDVMLRLIRANSISVERFADLGCGSGVLSSAILAQYPQSAGILIDFSEPMIKKAREKLSCYISNLHFIATDFGKSGWVCSIRDFVPFDVIVSGYAIHHQPDQKKQKLYREILDILRPGGLFVNLEHVASQTPWIGSISDDVFIDSLYTYHSKKGTGKTRKEIEVQYVGCPDKEANVLTPVEVQCE